MRGAIKFDMKKKKNAKQFLEIRHKNDHFWQKAFTMLAENFSGTYMTTSVTQLQRLQQVSNSKALLQQKQNIISGTKMFAFSFLCKYRWVTHLFCWIL